ncbi:SH3 domain-containing C40 family peptidase [Dongshaea marina]|uniref:SH3 domain-containing C40 family peptidase n=1 Tax=Dongshaea marina TaxID=2047966 RepID=UPI000D3E236E|nr:SH3 domain-containing C40 family peptidase [Dongshaea marina]
MNRSTILCCLFLFLCPQLVYASGFVNRPLLNIYSQQSRDGRVESQAVYGESLQVIHFDHAWTLVKTRSGTQGWVYGQVFGWHKHYASGASSSLMTVQRNNLIYRQPNISQNTPMYDLPFGVILPRVQRSHPVGGWQEVRLVDGRLGWIQEGDTRSGQRTLTLRQVLEVSHKFLGVPYLWAGSSSFGFDCSGFVKQLFWLMGLNLPRHSSAQASWNGFEKVSRYHLKPGDLLFFGERGIISHVGMYLGYINHNHEFIDATVVDNSGHSDPTVQLSNLDSYTWSHIFLEARRLKPALLAKVSRSRARQDA